jgi:PAS domain S-box-containing protein
VEINVSPLETEHGRLASAAIRDVSDRIRTHELTMRLATIVDTTDDAIVSKTLDGIVTSWNPAAQRIFGWHADEIVGRSINLIIPPGREAEEQIILQGLREGRSFQTYETVRRRKDRRDVEVSVTISPLRDANGEVIGASKIARDITRRKANERSVARAKEEAEIANRELEAFSYSVAHDLRAPLRSIDGFSRALLTEHFNALNEEAQKNLGRVRDSAQHMSHLIDALLDLSRISRTELRPRPVDLAALARESVRRLREQQPERIVEIEIEDELQTSGDARLLGILMDNLLGNAWKFTARTLRPQIEFGVELDDAGMIYFVRDNGAGFDMTYAPKLFNVFQRLHRREEYEGTGIGLATVQRIVHRHGGRIWAHGEVNRGATFYFTLQGGVSNGQQGSLLF